MKILASLIVVAALVAGCTTQATRTTVVSPSAAPVMTSTVNTYKGEVWTWDERENTVTLYNYGQTYRVRITPDQIRTLQLHQIMTVRGELAPPAEIPRVMLNTPMSPVARGTAETIEFTGPVSTSDANGRVSIDSARGPVHLWVASGAEQRFRAGSQSRGIIILQPVDMVPGSGSQPSASPSSAPSPSPIAEDYSVVVGRIIGVNPNGAIVIESPSGPIQVFVASPERYKVSDYVQVRTSLQPMQ